MKKLWVEIKYHLSRWLCYILMPLEMRELEKELGEDYTSNR